MIVMKGKIMMICKWMKFVELCGHLKKCCSPLSRIGCLPWETGWHRMWGLSELEISQFRCKRRDDDDFSMSRLALHFWNFQRPWYLWRQALQQRVTPNGLVFRILETFPKKWPTTKIQNFGGWCRQFQVEKPEEKREGPSGESVLVPVEGGNLRNVLSVHPTSRRRSKPGGDERRTRALGHNRWTSVTA